VFFPFVMCIIWQTASAYDYQVNDLEWASWPKYCKYAYVLTGPGRQSKYAKQISPTEKKKWVRILGPVGGLHHYCTGLLWMQKAKGSMSTEKQKQYYNRAIGEILYTYNSTNTNSVLYPTMSVELAKAYYAAGKRSKAVATLAQEIARHPNKSPAYIEYAKMLKEQGRRDESLDILKRGLDRVGDKSRRLHVALARLYVDMKQYEPAKYHADKAYSLGYRSPKLKKEIAKLRD